MHSNSNAQNVYLDTFIWLAISAYDIIIVAYKIDNHSLNVHINSVFPKS